MPRSPAAEAAGLRLAVAGKGGAGKSVIAGTMARVLARRGHRVLALDSDLMPGLAHSLGASPAAPAPLAEAADRAEDGRWRLQKGIGPVRVAQRFARPAPDGVRLLESGKLTTEGMPPVMGSVRAFYACIHGIGRSATFRAWTLLGDLPAGSRQVAFDWAPYARTILLLVEPTWQSALAARRVARIARARRGPEVLPVATKVSDPEDAARIEAMIGEPALGPIPLDPEVRAADRLGVALIDRAPEAPAVRAVERLVDLVAGRRMAGDEDRGGGEGRSGQDDRLRHDRPRARPLRAPGSRL